MQTEDEHILSGNNGAEVSLSLGQRLRSAREALELPLEQIATELRLDLHLLRALEEDRPELLGPRVFARGYIKQYASCLQLDETELLQAYDRLAGTGDVAIEPSKAIHLPADRPLGMWIVVGIIALSLIVLVLVWWMSDSDRLLQPELETVDPAEMEIEPRAGEEIGLAIGEEVAALEAPAAAGNRQAVAAAGAPAAGLVEPAPAASETRSGPLTVDAVAAAGEGENSEEPAAIDEDRVFVDGPAMSLELEFLEDSWADVTDVNGQRLFYRLGTAGERIDLVGIAPISVFLGYSEGVTLRVDGREYPVPRSRRGDIVRFTLRPAGE